jgi:hypothetical protein
MNRRLIFGVLGALLLVVVLVGVGNAVFHAGVATGMHDAAAQAVASGQPVADGAYGYPAWRAWGMGWGFGFFPIFGIVFWILGIFLVVGLFRAAFGAGRGGRWGGPGPGGPRGERLEEWHRELHRRAGRDRGCF